MNHDQNAERYPTRFSPELLTDFARTIGAMDRPTLLKLRADCLASMPVPDLDDVLLEIIDGNLALREIREMAECVA